MHDVRPELCEKGIFLRVLRGRRTRTPLSVFGIGLAVAGHAGVVFPDVLGMLHTQLPIREVQGSKSQL